MIGDGANLITQAISALKGDRKKLGVLGGLFILLVGLWARLLLNGPASATASMIRRSVAAMTESGAVSPKSSTNNSVMDWLSMPKRPLERNLFSVNLDYYPVVSGKPALTEDPAKSPGDAADQEKQVLVDNLQSEVGKMKLQTTVLGQERAAMINGQLLKQGDTINGFVLLRIESRRVTLEQDGIVLQLTMP